jgi:hypothetical protein
MGQNDPDIQIEIKTTGAAQAKKDIQDVAKETNKLVESYKSAGGGMKGLAAAGREVGKIYEEAGGGIKGLFSVLSGGGAKAVAIVGAIAGAAETAKKALEEFGGAETAVLKLQAALAQNALLTPQVNEHYQELATTLQELTGKADGRWIDVLNRLTQFGAKPDDIEKHVTAVKNLAGILGGDLEGAAIGVSKAMEGQFEMFARWGIHVDEAGTKAEKLDELYRQLAQKGAGQLEAASNSLNGQFERLKNSTNDLFKAFGQEIAKTGFVQDVLYGLGQSFHWVATKMSETIPVSDKMQNAFVRTGRAAVDAERFNKNYADSLKEIDDFAKAAGSSLQNQVDKMQQVARLQDEQTDAKMAQDIAIIDRGEKLYDLTGGKQGIAPDRAIAARARVRARAEGEKFNRQKDLRTQQIESLQKGITQGQIESEEYETTAQYAERDVVNEDEVKKKRDALAKKLAGEKQFWEQANVAFETRPWDFVNSEIGETAGPRTEADMARISSKINRKMRAARDAEASGLGNFDRENAASVDGSQQRARMAREEANKITSRNYQNENEATLQIERLQREQDSAARVHQLRSGTAGIEAGTQVAVQASQMADKAGRPMSGQAIQASAKSLQEEVFRSGEAMVGGLEQIRSTMKTNWFDPVNAELSRLNKAIQSVEKQVQQSRNK